MQHDISRRRNVGIVSRDPGSWMEALARSARAPQGAMPSAPARKAKETVVSPVAVAWAPSSGPFAGEAQLLTFLVADEAVPYERDALRAVDGAVLVLDARRSIDDADVRSFGRIRGRDLPCVVVISEIDEAGASFDARVAELEAKLGVVPIVVQRPVLDEGGRDEGGRAARGEGIRRLVDLLDQRELLRGRRDEGDDRAPRVPLVPSARAVVSELRRRVVDVVVEGDDALTGASSVGMDVGADELARALRRKIGAKGAPFVVVLGVGRVDETASILDAVATYLPSPDERPPARGVDPRRGISVARFARDEDALAALVIDVEKHPSGVRDVGGVREVVWLRVFSGTLSHEAKAWLFPRASKAEIGRIFVLSEGGLEEVDEVGPGHLAAVTGLTDARPGDTLADPRAPIVMTSPSVEKAVGASGAA